MSVLRIRYSLADSTRACEWAVIDVGHESRIGRGHLADLMQLVRNCESVQLLLTAADILLVRTRLPPGSGQRTSSVLAYAIEELIIGDPDLQHVVFLGASDREPGASVLAVMDKEGYDTCLQEIDALGASNIEVHHEALLMPWRPDEWSMAWDGREGFLRHGEREAGILDSGDQVSPPLALSMLLSEARVGGVQPTTLAIYAIDQTAVDAPDVDAWGLALGIKVRLAGTWDWRRAQVDLGQTIETRRRRWRLPTLSWPQLRPALWLLGAALIINAAALIIDWSLLANEQRQMRQQMDSRFRAIFPEAVAVVDPALQMRRKLVEARHAAGVSDETDFLPMAERLAAALQETAPGSLRTIAYESGRMTIELSGVDAAAQQRLRLRLGQSGLRLEQNSDAARGAASTSGGLVQMTVRAP